MATDDDAALELAQRALGRRERSSAELRSWLAARGVAPEHIEAAVATDGPAEQRERAVELLVRRAEPLDEERTRARALGYLTRKGYSYEVAHEALRVHERDVS